MHANMRRQKLSGTCLRPGKNLLASSGDERESFPELCAGKDMHATTCMHWLFLQVEIFRQQRKYVEFALVSSGVPSLSCRL